MAAVRAAVTPVEEAVAVHTAAAVADMRGECEAMHNHFSIL